MTLSYIHLHASVERVKLKFVDGMDPAHIEANMLTGRILLYDQAITSSPLLIYPGVSVEVVYCMQVPEHPRVNTEDI
jgi:hypothetical protein